jgi:multimeric flavodoxin WrbA
MKVIALNATYRPKQTTSRLVEKALEGAASEGAATEMVLLKDFDIHYCTNCLTCYGDIEAQIAACSIDDDMTMLLEKVKEADGIILASPVHNGFVTGLMTVFFERAIWRLCRPTGELLGLKGCPEPRLTDKARALATIVSAGMVPAELRAYCDTGTPWMLETGSLMLNGSILGDLYAAAFFPRELSDQDWPRAYFLRELTEEQLLEAFQLGVEMVRAIKENRIKPYDPQAALPSNPEWGST